MRRLEAVSGRRARFSRRQAAWTNWNFAVKKRPNRLRSCVSPARCSRNVPGFRGDILVSPVKPIARWKAPIVKRLYDRVKSKVSIDERRVDVTGYGTPFNYVARLNGGTIVKVAQGERPFTGDNNRYGFYEPGTVVQITAPEKKNGEPFVKWASVRGTFADASSRSTSYTTGKGDVTLSAIYGTQQYKLTVTGGTAAAAAPAAGQAVTVTAAADKDGRKFFDWTADTSAVDIADPSARSFKFAMPSEDVTLVAQGKK